MQKVMEIEGKQYNFKSSAAIPLIYSREFNSDLFQDLNKIDGTKEDELTTEHWNILFQLVYVFYKHGLPKGEEAPSIEEWLEQFDFFVIKDFVPVILEMWKQDQETKANPKKDKGQ